MTLSADKLIHCSKILKLLSIQWFKPSTVLEWALRQAQDKNIKLSSILPFFNFIKLTSL